MATLSEKSSLASALFGGGSSSSSSSSSSRRITATAATDSSGGTVAIVYDSDDSDEIEAACISSVTAGETVYVILQDGVPTVIGSAGWGDSVDAAIEDVDVTSLIRETSEGVEVASIEGGEYTSTRTLMGADGVQVDICTDADAEDPQWQTGLSIDSDSVDIYSDGELGMHIDADSLDIYNSGQQLATFSANPGTAYSYTELISSGALRISGGTDDAPKPVYINAPVDEEGNEPDTGIGLVPTESGNEDIPWDWKFSVDAGKTELCSSDNNLNVPVFIGRRAESGPKSAEDLTAESLTGVSFGSTYRHTCTTDLVATTAVAYGSFGFDDYAGSSSELTVAEIVQGGVYLVAVGTYFTDDDGTSHLVQVRMLPDSSSTSDDVVTLCEQQGPGELRTPFAMGVFELDAGNVLAWGVRAQGSGDTVNWGAYSSQMAIVYLGTA